MKSYSLFIDNGIIDYRKALYILSLFHIGNSIVDGGEAASTDVFGGEVYVTPFLCSAVLTKHNDAVWTVATNYFDIHKQ